MIKQEIEEKINKKVDILTFDSINPILKRYILNNQEILLWKKILFYLKNPVNPVNPALNLFIGFIGNKIECWMEI